MTAQLLTDRDGANGEVMRITLHNPEGYQTLSPEVYAAGVELFTTAERDASIRAVILTGSSTMFCAGGNLKRLNTVRQMGAEGKAQQAAAVDQLASWIDAIRLCPKPVIAAIEGAAAGAGLSLALACDFIIAARQTKFVMAYVNSALSPDGGGTWQLMHALPRALASEAALLGKPLQAERLLALGVINEICEPGNALAHAQQWANELCTKPANAMASIKEQLCEAQDQSLAAQFTLEREHFVYNLFHANAGEGIHAFLEKRKPRFES
jgi:enoyl-CoA hydratase/carnithine racemase